MSNNTSYPCSCLVCKQVKTSKGIHSHYLISHTTEGKERNRKNRLAAGHKGSEIAKQIAIENRNKLIFEYQGNPNHCSTCNKILSFEGRNNKFCSSSCSATHSNKNRKYIPRDEVTKQRISTSVKNSYQLRSAPKYSKISFCQICSDVIKNAHRKTCSKKCQSSLMSNMAIERIKQNKRSNYRRDKRSYLEESFEQWIQSTYKNLKYKTEYTIHNHITKQWYFVDFYFPDINLIVELDGKQHEDPLHKQKDRLRDDYIRNYLHIPVFRISHSEYQSGSKIEELRLAILNGRAGGNRTHTGITPPD